MTEMVESRVTPLAFLMQLPILEIIPKNIRSVVQRSDNFNQCISHYPTLSVCCKDLSICTHNCKYTYSKHIYSSVQGFSLVFPSPQKTFVDFSLQCPHANTGVS